MEESGIPSLLIVLAAAAVVIGVTVGMAAVTWAFIFSSA